jgi:DNA-directed RNA polymerase specialized sigma24 family protein
MQTIKADYQSLYTRARGGDKQSRDDLIVALLPLAERIAAARSTASGGDIGDDVLGDVSLALVEQVDAAIKATTAVDNIRNFLSRSLKNAARRSALSQSLLGPSAGHLLNESGDSVETPTKTPLDAIGEPAGAGSCDDLATRELVAAACASHFDRQVVELTAAENTRQETATALGVSQPTVSRSLTKTRERYQAIASSLATGV